MSEISNLINMGKASLEKLSKSELINLVLKQQKTVPTPKRPIPTPRKSVKDMVQQYEDNIIIPPIPAPRTKKPSKIPIPIPKTIKRTITSQVEKALKGFTQSFDVELR